MRRPVISAHCPLSDLRTLIPIPDPNCALGPNSNKHVYTIRQTIREKQVKDDKTTATPAPPASALWDHAHEIHEKEHVLLKELRQLRRDARQEAKEVATGERLTAGQRVADTVAEMMGSWTFIIVQSGILAIWVVLNIVGWIKAWDPYPFILLNLALSFQAAYAAPIIMMSQNRQQDIDRKAAENDYRINIKAELEIELLHHKLDDLRDQEVLELSKAVRELAELLAAKPATTRQKTTPPAGQKTTPPAGQKTTPPAGQKTTPPAGQKTTPRAGQKPTPRA